MNHHSTYSVSFKPAQSQVKEIEQWLMGEDLPSDGLFHKLRMISLSFAEKRLALMISKGQCVGFVIWTHPYPNFKAAIELFEIHPQQQNKGYGRQLLLGLFEHFREKNVCVVDLVCSPRTSETIYKCFGFLDYPATGEHNLFLKGISRSMYQICISHAPTALPDGQNEFIELWNEEPRYSMDHAPAWTWKLEFKKGTRELIHPIIHPCQYHWRVDWTLQNRKLRTEQIKNFDKNLITLGRFLMISRMPELPLNLPARS